MKNKVKYRNEIVGLLLVLFAGVISATGLHVFVYNAEFAPSGIDGVATILQYVTGYNAGYFTLLLNLPLLIVAWFILNKRYVIYTLIYTLVTSILLRVYPLIPFVQKLVYDCSLPNNTHIVAAIFGGLCQGCTGLMLKIGGSSGGVDVLGSMIQKKIPHKNVEKIIAYLSYAVVAVSFFVYDMNVNSVCLSVIQIFICEKITATLLRDRRSAIKFEIITDKSVVENIKNLIIFDFKHSATILKGEGAFENSDKEVIVCLISYYQLPEFLKKIKNFPNTFVYYSDIMGIRGNFDFHKGAENPYDKKLLEQRIQEREMLRKNHQEP